MNQSVINTKLGNFLVIDESDKVHLIKPTVELEKLPLSLLAKQLKIELNEYFEGLRTSFSVPITFEGTPFEQTVMYELRKVKYGETLTYKELAIRSQNPNSARAVGSVCRKNPLLFLVPCHRVIKADGSYGNYVLGNKIKKSLIELEKHSS